jgi:hypothetical protein
VTIAVEVTVFLFVDIEVDWQTEWHVNQNAGPCDLPDVV